jgi:predicted nucleic acid-binding protein
MYLLDSNVFIAYISPEDRLHQMSYSILEAVQKGRLSAVASSVSIMETIYVLKKYKKTNAEINDGAHALLSLDNLAFLPITSSVVMEAADVILSYNVGLSDAIIAVSSVKSGAKAIISDDKDFDRIPFAKRIAIKDALSRKDSDETR